MEEKTTSFKKNANGSYSKKGVVRQTPKDGFVEQTGRAAWNTAKGTASGGLMKQTTLKLHARFYIFFSLFLWAFGIGFFIAVHRVWTLRGVCMWQLLVWA